MRHSTYIDPYRMIWLAAHLLWNDSVSYYEYRRRFGLSMQTFREDVRITRRAGRKVGFYIYFLMVGAIVQWVTELR